MRQAALLDRYSIEALLLPRARARVLTANRRCRRRAVPCCSQLCLRLINIIVILCGGALGAVAMTSSSSGAMSGASWTNGLYGVAIGLVVSGLLGQWVAHQGMKEVDVFCKAYFTLMVCLTMVMLWLSLFMTFNLNEVKWLVKGWIYTHWGEFWSSLEPQTQDDLADAGGCSADGKKMSELNDDCWEALKQYIFRSWKVGGLLAVLLAVLLPFNIFFAGTKIGWGEAMDAVQSFISLVSIGNGACVRACVRGSMHGVHGRPSHGSLQLGGSKARSPL
jgi:hypothetical protein